MLTHLQSGKYEIIRELAQGGMGKIYLAKHTTLNRQVAIKALHAQYSSDEAFIERFLREARAMAQLDHPNIVSVYDVFEDQGSYFIVMEFCPGQSLDAKIRSAGTLPVKYTLEVALQVARGLQYAHERDIIHRDIKPANIMVDDAGRVKLTDFGIAAAKNLSGLTATGQVIGSPQYMSPEQASGGELDGRSDLYSLGMVMYKMLSGKTPLEGHSLISIMGKLVYQAEELEYKYPDAIPKAVTSLISQLVQRDPGKRVGDARALIEKIQAMTRALEKPAAPPRAAGIDATEFLSPGETRRLSHAQQARATGSKTVGMAQPPPAAVIWWRQPRLQLAMGLGTLLIVISGGVWLSGGKNPPATGGDATATAPAAPKTAPTTAAVPPAATSAPPGEPLLALRDKLTKQQAAVAEQYAGAQKAAQDELLKPQLAKAVELEGKGKSLLQQAQAAFAQGKYAAAEPLYRDAGSYLSQAQESYDNLLHTNDLVAEVSALHAELESLDNLYNNVAASRRAANERNAKTYAAQQYTQALATETQGLTALDDSRTAVRNRRVQDARKLLADSRRLGELANNGFKNALDAATVANRDERSTRLRKNADTAAAGAAQARNEARDNGAMNEAQTRYNDAAAQESRAQARMREAEQLATAGKEEQAVKAYDDAAALFLAATNAYRTAGGEALAARSRRDSVARAAQEKIDYDIVTNRLQQFKKVYADKDLAELETLTQMSPQRRDFLQRLFDNYDNVHVSISSFAINSNSARAVVTIDKLSSKSGDQVIPGDSWKNTEVEMKKNGDQWGQITW